MGYGEEEQSIDGLFDRSLEVSLTVDHVPEQAPDLGKVKASRKDQSDSYPTGNLHEQGKQTG